MESGFTLRAIWALRDEALRDDRKLSPADWKLAMALISFCDEHGRCFPSVRSLAKAARTSPGAVRRSLRKLEMGDGPLRLRIERRGTAAGDAETHMYHLSVQGWDQPDPTRDHADPGVGSPKPGGGITQAPLGGITQAPEEDIRKKTIKRTSSRALARDGQTLLLAIAPESSSKHKRVTECYFAAFVARRGAQPTFGDREGKAVASLLKKLGGDDERACALIRSAFEAGNILGETASILTIANDPAKYMRSRNRPSNGAAGPRQPNHGAFDASAYLEES
jgi:hypothetical protein